MFGAAPSGSGFCTVAGGAGGAMFCSFTGFHWHLYKNGFGSMEASMLGLFRK